MSSNNSSNTGGTGFVGLLTLLFIGLKLTGFINWPWIWVLSPLWIGTLVVVFIVLLFIIIAALSSSIK